MPDRLPRVSELVPEIVDFIAELDGARASPTRPAATSISVSRVSRLRTALAASGLDQPRGQRAERAQGGPARLRSLEGDQGRRGHLVGLALGAAADRLAHRVLGDGRADARRRRSRSTVAASTSSSRTTRTSSPSRARSAIRSRRSGRTTGCCELTEKKMSKSEGNIATCERCSTAGAARRCSSTSSAATGASRSTSQTTCSVRPPRRPKGCPGGVPRPFAAGARGRVGASSAARSTMTSTRRQRSPSCTAGATTSCCAARSGSFRSTRSRPPRTRPPPVRALAEQRRSARAARDFVRADELRVRLEESGWEMRDGEGGAFRLVRRA